MRILLVEAISATASAWRPNTGIDGLEAARRLGLTSIVASEDPGAALHDGMEDLADSWIQCDTSAGAAVADAARTAKADAIISWVDAFVPVAARAAGLAGLGSTADPRSPAVAGRKDAVRARLDTCGVRNVRWGVADAQTPPTDPPTGYPSIVKPVDGSSSRDTALASDRREFLSACAAHARRNTYGHAITPAHQMICEEVLYGPLVSVEGMVSDGEVTVWGYSDREHTGSAGFLETSFAFAGTPLDAALEDYARQVVKALDYEMGGFHLEAILTADGPTLVEFNARLASGIYQCIDLATGGSCLEELLRGVAGLRPTLQRPSRAASRVYLLAEPTGRVTGIPEASSLPGVTGISVRAPGGTDPRLCHVQAVGSTREESRAIARAAVELLGVA